MIKPLHSVKNDSLEHSYLAENIYLSLQTIQLQLEKEIISKQKSIERQEEEIRKLRSELEQKSKNIIEVNAELTLCLKNAEGNRQLINKLLNDIERLRQDIDWYKRTYESRSLLGVIKDRIKFLFSK